MCQTYLDIVGMRDIMPMAWRSGNPLLVLDCYRDFDIDILHGRSLFGNFLVNFCGNIDFYRHFGSNWDFALLEHFYLYRHVDFDFFLDFYGYFDFDYFGDKGRFVVIFFDFNDEGNLFGDSFHDGLGFFDLDGDLDHFRNLYSHRFHIVLRHLHRLSPRNNFRLSR